MKKLFTLIAAALIGINAFADVDIVYHAPKAKKLGTPFEYVNVSNALVSGQAKVAGGTGYGIDLAQYPWIVYNYSASMLENGTSEVSKGGIYVSYNPIWMNSEFTYMVDDAEKWNGSPKLEIRYPGTKSAAGYLTAFNPETMRFNVTATTRVDFLLTGGGSNTNDVDVVVKNRTNEVVKTIYVENMPGKSQQAASGEGSKATNSKWVKVDGLDPTVEYSIYLYPSIKNATVNVTEIDEFGDESKVDKPAAEVLGVSDFSKDIALTDAQKVNSIKAPAFYVTALHIYSSDLSVNGEKEIRDASTTFFDQSKEEYYPGAVYSYTKLANASTQSATQTTWDANGDPVIKEKVKAWINTYPWIDYSYTASRVNGVYAPYHVQKSQMEANLKSMTYSFDPLSDEQVATAMGQNDKDEWMGTPCVENGYTKSDAGYFNAILPKTLTFNVKAATDVKFAMTGAGSTKVNQPLKNNKYNSVDIIVKAADGSESWVITTDSLKMQGKSYKASDATTKSELVSVNGLANDGQVHNIIPEKEYTITIAPAYAAARFKIKALNPAGEDEATYPFVSQILPAVKDFSADITLTDAQKVEDILTGSVNVAAVRVYGENTTPKSLNEIINGEIKNKKNSFKLVLPEYNLTGSAEVLDTVFTLEGNNRKINVSGNGCFVSKKSLTINNVMIDASQSNVAPIRLASLADLENQADSFNLYGYQERFSAIEAKDFNNIHKPAIDAGTLNPVKVGQLYTSVPSQYLNVSDGVHNYSWGPYYVHDYVTGIKKYDGTDEAKPYALCNQRAYFADSVTLSGVYVKTRNGLIWGNDAPWALDKLTIDSCMVEVDATSTVPVINFYGGANSIRSINIAKSTLYATGQNSKFYFLRYTNSSNASPFKTYGYNSSAEWNMTNNTFVNMSANQNFANNYLNLGKYTDKTKGVIGNAQCTLNWYKNVFANTYRLQKVNTGNTWAYMKEDGTTWDNSWNLISGTTNPVDNTDKTKFATEEDADLLGVWYVSSSDYEFSPSKYSYAAKIKAGDPRWLKDVEYVNLNAMNELKDLLSNIQGRLDVATPEMIAIPEYDALSVEMTKANTIVASATYPNPTDDQLLAAMAEYDPLLAAYNAWCTATETGISSVNAQDVNVANKVYNISGQRVNANAKGIIIINGKKYFNK